MTATSTAPAPEPLLDLQKLVAGVRWRRRIWVSLAVLGLLAGALLAVLAPPPPTAVARLLIVHESESTGSGQMETDVALLETTRIAAAALGRINATTERPEDFLKNYEAEGLTANVLELTVSGSSDRDAVVRARALAEAFIADHLQRTEAAANAEAQALIDRRSQVEAELAGVGDAARRAELTARIQELGQRAQEASIGAPSVAAGTRIVDGPRAITDSPLVTGVMNAVVGLVLGLGAGLALAAVASVVADRPVLRRDIAAALGASVIAQLPPPHRGPARLWRRSLAVTGRRRVAATLVRTVRDDPEVSLLELGCPATAATLALDIAGELAVDRPFVVVDGLPGRHLRKLTGKTQSPLQITDAADVDRSSPPQPEHHLGVGSVGPGTAWTDLGQLGSETLLVVRAGHANTLWLHTVARQLADAQISVIGVVLVHPDPRDRSDGTLWDGLHTAVRGRAARRAGSPPPEAAVPGPEMARAPHSAAACNGAAVAAPRAVPRAVPLVVPERRFGRGVNGTSRTEELSTDGSPEVEPSKTQTVEVS